MNIRISGGRLCGRISAIASKSCAHRLLICAALADAPCTVEIAQLSADIEATARCLSALGAEIRRTDSGYHVTPVDFETAREAALDCGESGSTLRFLLPVAARMAEGSEIHFMGSGRLPERPNTVLTRAMRMHGAAVSADNLPMTVEGSLQGGMYRLPGNVSSQYISGLLFALPTLKQSSFIRFSTEVESASYIELTVSALRQFGIEIRRAEGGYDIPGNQKFVSPGTVRAEGDWSNAAFWMTARALGSDVTVEGLNMDSVQGDRAVMRILDSMRHADGKLYAAAVDASDIPDLVPILSVAATQAEGETVFYNAGRLRIKECDRLAAMCECLSALGGDVTETKDGLIVRGGKKLHGGEVRSFNDHRIVMAMAIAATVIEGDVLICGAEAVAKSYPNFFEDYQKLGGMIREE